MEPDPIPPEIDALLQRIESFEQLKVILFLQPNPEEWRSAASVAVETKLSEASALEALRLLSQAHLIELQEMGDRSLFRGGSADPVPRKAIDALAAAYREKDVDIIRRLNANAIERVRTSALRTLANAFLLRKGRKSDG